MTSNSRTRDFSPAWPARLALAAGIALSAAFAALVASPAIAAAPARPPAAKQWAPEGCPPAPAPGRGRSTIKVTGPCGFQYKGEAECNTELDDMQMMVKRPAKNGGELLLYVNIERYVGAGRYKPPNDLYVSLMSGRKIYRWSSNDYSVVVAPGSAYVVFDNVVLEPELPLEGCTGPQWNYQCDGRGHNPLHMATTATVTGTLYCKAGGPKKATVPIP